MSLKPAFVLGTYYFLTFIFTLVSPQALSWFPVAVSAAAIWFYRAELLSQVRVSDRWLISAVLALLFWALLTGLYAPQHLFALRSILGVSTIIVATHINTLAIRSMKPTSGTFGTVVIVGHVAFACILLALFLDLFSLEMIRGARAAQQSEYNRAAVWAVLLLPLTLLAVRQKYGCMPYRKMIVGIFVILLTIYTTMQSTSESAKLTMIVIVAVSALVLVAPIVGTAMIVGATIAIVFLAPFVVDILSTLFYESDLSKFNPGTFQARVEIWQSLQAPIFSRLLSGNGVEYVRFIDIFSIESRNIISNTHPHSFIIQIWLDLGFVGVLLFSIVVLIIFRSWRLKDRFAHASKIAYFTGVLAVMSVSHGMWQAWWAGMVSLGITFLLALLKEGNMQCRATNPS